jgi:hypothetical protein
MRVREENECMRVRAINKSTKATWPGQRISNRRGRGDISTSIRHVRRCIGTGGATLSQLLSCCGVLPTLLGLAERYQWPVLVVGSKRQHAHLALGVDGLETHKLAMGQMAHGLFELRQGLGRRLVDTEDPGLGLEVIQISRRAIEVALGGKSVVISAVRTKMRDASACWVGGLGTYREQ